MNRDVKGTSAQELEKFTFKVYGGLKLDNEKCALLALGPDFAMMEDIMTTRAARDFLIALTKIRWGRMGKTSEEITQYVDKEIQKESEYSERKKRNWTCNSHAVQK